MPNPKDGPRATELFYGAVTIGERGQIVIPAEARKYHSLLPGDKLLVFRHPHMHGMVLTRLDDVEQMLGELREWVKLFSQAREETVAPAAPATRKKRTKGG